MSNHCLISLRKSSTWNLYIYILSVNIGSKKRWKSKIKEFPSKHTPATVRQPQNASSLRRRQTWKVEKRTTKNIWWFVWVQSTHTTTDDLWFVITSFQKNHTLGIDHNYTKSSSSSSSSSNLTVHTLALRVHRSKTLKIFQLVQTHSNKSNSTTSASW